MVSKISLNQKLLNKRVQNVTRKGFDKDDVVINSRFVSRKCLNCGNSFITYKKKSFVYCVDCCKIRKNRIVKKQ